MRLTWDQFNIGYPLKQNYHTHFLLTVITYLEGSNEVSMGPVQHWLPFVKTAALFKSQKILFKARAVGSNLLQPKKD